MDYAEAVKREAEYAKDSNVGSYMYFFKYQERRMCVDATAETIYVSTKRLNALLSTYDH